VNISMEILRSVLGGNDTGAQVSSAETIERLVDRVNTSTLLEDRRDACRALKAMSRKFRLEVGAQGLSSLLNVLRTDNSDAEIVSYVLDTFCNICSPEEFEEEVVDETREDITGVGEGFSEMFLKEKDNLSLVLTYLEEFDFKIRRPAVQLMTYLLTNCVREVQQQLLDSHIGVSRMMDILSDTREVLRNDALIMLFKVTKGNANLQKIVAFENAFDKLFEVMEAEGWTDGGIVVEDCLRLLLNLLRNNPSNQTFFKEGSYINRIKPALDVFDTEDHGWDAQKVANMLHILHLVRTLVSPTNPGHVTSACQSSVSQSGLLSLLTRILLASGIPADVLTETINTLAEVIRGCNQNQQQFLAVSAPSVPPRPAIILLLMSMVNDKQPFSLRCAVLYCFQSYLYKNPEGQGSIVASLLPANDQVTDISAGQLLCGGLFSPDPVSNWLCSAALSHVFLDSEKLRQELLRVQLSTTGTTPVPLLSQCVKLLQHTNTTNIATKCGLLQLLCSWVFSCPPAATMLLESKDSLSFLLNQIGSNEHDERERLAHGLCSVLLGLCILHNENTVQGASAHDLTQLVQKRLGKDMFLDKISDIPKHESYIRALKSPQLKCASTADLLFDHMFCELFRSVDRDITNILSERSTTPHNTIENESGDIMQYKNFIREQDAKMNQFVEANNQLHSELTSVRSQLEESVAQIQILQDKNAILEAQNVNGVCDGVSPVKVTSSCAEETVNHADSLKLENLEKQMKHKDEYIAELEARLNKDDSDMNEKLLTVVAYNQSQTIEIKNLKQQLESLREIMMGKDEQIMKLKNDLPIKPKSGGTGPQDRFENMFMTSLELEAHKKKLTGAELEIRVTELEHIKCEQDKEIEDLTKERNTLEKELLESKHRIDDLEELNKDQGNSSFLKLEQELRDAKCFIEELKENKDTASLQQQDTVMMEKLLKDTEIKLHQTTEQLQVSQQQLYALSVNYEQLRVSKSQEITTEIDNNEIAAVKAQLENTKKSLEGVQSEQEDLLVMLSEQEEIIKKYRARLRELGENIVSEEEDDDDDLT